MAPPETTEIPDTEIDLEGLESSVDTEDEFANVVFYTEREFIAYIASVVNEICKFKPHTLEALTDEETLHVTKKLNGRHNSKEYKLAVAISPQHPIVHMDYYRAFDVAVGNKHGDRMVRKRPFTTAEDEAHRRLEKKYSPQYDIQDAVRCYKLLSKSDFFNLVKVVHAGQYIVYRSILRIFKFKHNRRLTNMAVPGVMKVLNIEDISECFGISKYHFHRMFKSLTNVTIKEYETICEMFVTNHKEEFQEIICDYELFYEHGPVLMTMSDRGYWKTVATMLKLVRPNSYAAPENFLEGFYVDLNTNANNRASKKRNTANMKSSGRYHGNGRDSTTYGKQVVTRDFRRTFFGRLANSYESQDLDKCLSYGFTDADNIPDFEDIEIANLTKPRRTASTSRASRPRVVPPPVSVEEPELMNAVEQLFEVEESSDSESPQLTSDQYVQDPIWDDTQAQDTAEQPQILTGNSAPKDKSTNKDIELEHTAELSEETFSLTRRNHLSTSPTVNASVEQPVTVNNDAPNPVPPLLSTHDFSNSFDSLISIFDTQMQAVIEPTSSNTTINTTTSTTTTNKNQVALGSRTSSTSFNTELPSGFCYSNPTEFAHFLPTLTNEYVPAEFLQDNSNTEFPPSTNNSLEERHHQFLNEHVIFSDDDEDQFYNRLLSPDVFQPVP